LRKQGREANTFERKRGEGEETFPHLLQFTARNRKANLSKIHSKTSRGEEGKRGKERKKVKSSSISPISPFERKVRFIYATKEKGGEGKEGKTTPISFMFAKTAIK